MGRQGHGQPLPRWNVGLAPFLQGLLQERVEGWTGREATDDRVIGRVRQKVAADSLLRVVPFADCGHRGMTDESNWVAHVMFCALYELLREQDFNRIVGGYHQRCATRGATAQPGEFAERSTSPSLTPFLDNWLYSTRWTGVDAISAAMGDPAEHYRTSETGGW